MKPLRILFIFMLAAIFTPSKGYSNSEKIYIEPSNLYFSDEGIFLKTSSDEWKPIGHICYDVQGYYIKINDLDFNVEPGLIANNQENEQEFYGNDAEIIECGSRVSPQPQKWRCPYCGRRWFLGEECKYEKCPTNQWKKNKEES